MQKNVGTTDKIVRIILGLVIIILGIIYGSWWGLIGVIPLLTAFISFCPIYAPFKISTFKRKKTTQS
ncbi:MAG TPA: DUF2892 domain-containing protein [Ignavibacteria bacterium]|nr:DUF2892 domain-containing protein [Ignavibacteria bacterium]